MKITKKLHAAIIEDDPIVSQQLTHFLAQTELFDNPLVCESSTKALLTLRVQPVDIIFLDMKLPDMMGLDLLKLIPQRPPVVVVSAYPEFAVDCYDQDIRDFISKPLTYSRFLRSLNRTVLLPESVMQPHEPDRSSTFSSEAAQASANTSTPNSALSAYIYLKTGRKTERFAYQDILYFKAYTVYARVITNKGSFVINESLANLEKLLNSTQFMRVHKSYLISLDKITQFSANTIWINTHKISIGITFKNKVQERLKQLTILAVND
jgi:DNA-binding LytR/AlgR family response regulator